MCSLPHSLYRCLVYGCLPKHSPYKRYFQSPFICLSFCLSIYLSAGRKINSGCTRLEVPIALHQVLDRLFVLVIGFQLFGSIREHTLMKQAHHIKRTDQAQQKEHEQEAEEVAVAQIA